MSTSGVASPTVSPVVSSAAKVLVGGFEHLRSDRAILLGAFLTTDPVIKAEFITAGIHGPDTLFDLEDEALELAKQVAKREIVEANSKNIKQQAVANEAVEFDRLSKLLESYTWRMKGLRIDLEDSKPLKYPKGVRYALSGNLTRQPTTVRFGRTRQARIRLRRRHPRLSRKLQTSTICQSDRHRSPPKSSPIRPPTSPILYHRARRGKRIRTQTIVFASGLQKGSGEEEGEKKEGLRPVHPRRERCILEVSLRGLHMAHLIAKSSPSPSTSSRSSQPHRRCGPIGLSLVLPRSTRRRTPWTWKKSFVSPTDTGSSFKALHQPTR